MLQPEGQLINVHDIPVQHAIEVHSAGSVIKAGWLLDSADFDSERFAFNALAQVVSENYFMLVDERDFIVNLQADDIQELQEWLAGRWETAVIPENTVQRVDDILRQVGQSAHVVLKEPTRMTKLRAMR
ncbi:MAG: hypothetical protein JSV37_07110 [Anaerolineaceae bacterium]|nr:MAG: hypothetical protein JSV37_07110 [Anaerolineaceae bacterium]